MKTADEILKANKCGDIFSRADKKIVISEYRQLAKIFHPDHCSLPNANSITSKLNALYEKALEMIERGEWEISNVIELHDTTGKKYIGRYLKAYPFELGMSYVSDSSVTYVFEKQHEKFFANALSQIKSLRYANPEMEKEISRYMPNIRYSFKMPDGRCCLIVSKTPDVFLLADILEFYGGTIPDRHAAWIMSRLCNLCCYFEYLGIAHNGLTLQTCFISPQYHTILPLGGWWYARNAGDSLIGVSRSVYDVMSVKAKSDKVSSIRTDLEAAKLIGRQIIDQKCAPQPILEFLNAGSSSKATEEFGKWSKTLDAAYGKRQFVEMKISKLDIYK